MTEPIFLDYNATTPVRSEVLNEMLPLFREQFGNPSSTHVFGSGPAKAIRLARERLSDLMGCHPDEIVFTSCGSEADNMAVKGVAEALKDKGNHIITTVVEHPAVVRSCQYLASKGFETTFLPVDADCQVDPGAVERAITPRTILVSVMHANNEVGTLQPLAEIAVLARERGVYFRTDAAQTVGKLPVKVDEIGVDLLTVAGNKFYAPKGVGGLYVRRGTMVEPLVHGGGQERGLRAGTENAALIAGLGKTAELAEKEMPENVRRFTELRDLLFELLNERVGRIKLNGHLRERLPNTLNVCFQGVKNYELLAASPELAASTGSGCHAGRREPSAVLTAMGVRSDLAMGAVRFSVGLYTTEDEINRAAQIIAERIGQLRD